MFSAALVVSLTTRVRNVRFTRSNVFIAEKSDILTEFAFRRPELRHNRDTRGLSHRMFGIGEIDCETVLFTSTQEGVTGIVTTREDTTTGMVQIEINILTDIVI